MNIGQYTESAVSVYAMKAAAQVGSASICADALHHYHRPRSKAVHKTVHCLKACYPCKPSTEF